MRSTSIQVSSLGDLSFPHPSMIPLLTERFAEMCFARDESVHDKQTQPTELTQKRKHRDFFLETWLWSLHVR